MQWKLSGGSPCRVSLTIKNNIHVCQNRGYSNVNLVIIFHKIVKIFSKVLRRLIA